MSIGLSNKRRLFIGLLPAALVMTAFLTTAFKIGILGYDLHDVAPSESYFVEMVMEFIGHGSDVEIELALPSNLPTQTIRDESYASKDMKFSIVSDNGNRTGYWEAENISGRHLAGFTATVITESRKYDIDSTLPTVQKLPPNLGRYLLADSTIQSNSPELAELATRLGLSDSLPMIQNVRTMFDFVTDSMAYVGYSGTTDALTAYRLNEASCGGKSRLMVALARHLSIPGRLVGGKIMKSGKSIATHIWVELYIYGHWVPFCPTNGYFGELPSNYMILYYGEKPALTHTKDINFRYYFNLKKRLVPATSAADAAHPGHLDALNLWGIFKRAAISLELLRIILMLPMGVLVVVIYRNLIGLQSFGTFMPALLAVGFRDTGLINGLIMFVAVLAVGSLVRAILDKFLLLHTPRLAIILTTVITFLLTATALSVSFGLLDMAKVALFPMVILTMTVERFSIITEEDGFGSAAWISLQTMLITTSVYLVMSNKMLQTLTLSFPEILLVLLALFLYIGRYAGFRLSELLRFRDLMTRSS